MRLAPLLRTLAVATLASLLAACTTVPGTGRSQLILLNASEEMQMGLQSFEQIKSQTPRSKDAARTRTVEEVGRRIAAVVAGDVPNAQWEFVLFASDDINAFALPGGKVGVYEGLMNVATTPDELAVVMGHEVAHVVARHGAERVSQQMAVGIAGTALAVGVRNMSNEDQALILGLYGAGATLGVMLPYSRTHESEADELGLRYMAQAGYDPRAAVTFWRKMQRAKGNGGPPEFLSTHPSDDTRIRNLEALMPEALAIYQRHAFAGRGPLLPGHF